MIFDLFLFLFPVYARACSPALRRAILPARRCAVGGVRCAATTTWRVIGSVPVSVLSCHARPPEGASACFTALHGPWMSRRPGLNGFGYPELCSARTTAPAPAPAPVPDHATPRHATPTRATKFHHYLRGRYRRLPSRKLRIPTSGLAPSSHAELLSPFRPVTRHSSLVTRHSSDQRRQPSGTISQ